MQTVEQAAAWNSQVVEQEVVERTHQSPQQTQEGSGRAHQSPQREQVAASEPLSAGQAFLNPQQT